MKRRLVDTWLETRRYRELSIERSLELWEGKYPAPVPTVRAPRRGRQYTIREGRGAGRCSMYLDVDTVREVRSEAVRQDRAFSWLLQQAWDLAKDTLRKFPAPEVP